MADATDVVGLPLSEWESKDNSQLTVTNTSNRLVRNVGAYPVTSFAFMLRVEGLWDLPCKRIMNMKRENEFDYIQEGGLNDYVHLKRKALSKPFTFQVERYVGVDKMADPLGLGTELVLPLILFVNKYSLWDTSGDNAMKPVRTYAFTGCTVIAKDYGDLNSEQSALLVETTTIAYREMICVDVYSDFETMNLDAWGFDGKKKEGTGPRRYNQAVSNTTELTAEQKNAAARKWNIQNWADAADKSKVTYSEGYSASAASSPSTKLDAKDKRLWDINETTVTDEKGNVTPSHGDASAATSPSTDAKQRLWTPGTDEKSFAGSGGSAAGSPSTKATARLWDINETVVTDADGKVVMNTDGTPKVSHGDESAATSPSTDAKQRIWTPGTDEKSFAGSNGSAVASLSTKATARVWTPGTDEKSFAGSNGSAATSPSTSVETPRAWKIGDDAKDYKGSGGSAVTSPSTKATPRLWDINETTVENEDGTTTPSHGDGSAATSPSTSVENARVWQIGDAGENYKGSGGSAVTSPSTLVESPRAWKIGDAGENYKGSGGSATTSTSTKATPRLWPGKKSARSITEYLSQK